MGLCVHQTGQKFFLHSSKIDACVASILSNEKLAKNVAEAKKKIKYFENIPGVFQLVELVKKLWGFQLTPNKHGDIDKIAYEQEKLIPDYDYFCHTFAPHVESGSYIEFFGDDSEAFRFLFKDNAWSKVSPKLIWPD